MIMHYCLKPILLVPFLAFNIGCASKMPLLSNAGHPVDGSANPVASWKELNEQNVIMQHYDYSCGAASLATLMKYYFNDDISEKEILGYIKSTFSKQEYAEVEKDGLSLLDLEKSAVQWGTSLLV
ncbi:MAG: hypothetical protein KZQ88_09655 [Candidatus Thiodiazotropha sp. (ex Dulcina madagascariensis)]|nr:hypothetical protein [Candidatus Thiodiazotropha sp. (ex Dulcina madagascariensis)]MCU7926085.1 hypothetical protein [Candidatus Thiodiazotropha sp. (ex Dulcina madagascariensis)]